MSSKRHYNFDELCIEDKIAINDIIRKLTQYKVPGMNIYDILDVKKIEKKIENNYYKNTIVKGIVCKKCNNELPSMTMEQHLNSEFNQECPHK